MADDRDNHGSTDNNSNVSEAMANATCRDGCSIGQEWLLPIANVGRIMKQALPPTAKVSKEAKETMQECVSEFIGFIMGEASERCRSEKRKTVNGDDICCAMKTVGLDRYADATLRYLHKYREHEERAHAAAKQDKSIQIIDVTDELSTLRYDQSRSQQLDFNERNEIDGTQRFL